MKDRIPKYPGRVKLTPVSGQTNTYDITRADEPTEAGTPLNKATLLTDETAELIGLDPDDNPTVDDAIKTLATTASGAVGDILCTVRTDLDDNWALCDGAVVIESDVPKLFGKLKDSEALCLSNDSLSYTSTMYPPAELMADGNASVPIYTSSAQGVGLYNFAAKRLTYVDTNHYRLISNLVWNGSQYIYAYCNSRYSVSFYAVSPDDLSNPTLVLTQSFTLSADISIGTYGFLCLAYDGYHYFLTIPCGQSYGYVITAEGDLSSASVSTFSSYTYCSLFGADGVGTFVLFGTSGSIQFCPVGSTTFTLINASLGRRSSNATYIDVLKISDTRYWIICRQGGNSTNAVTFDSTTGDYASTGYWSAIIFNVTGNTNYYMMAYRYYPNDKYVEAIFYNYGASTYDLYRWAFSDDITTGWEFVESYSSTDDFPIRFSGQYGNNVYSISQENGTRCGFGTVSSTSGVGFFYWGNEIKALPEMTADDAYYYIKTS